jgi:hypothetical protein
MIGNSGGINQAVEQRKKAYASNPQALQQRYQGSQELMDLLALQEINKEMQAKKNQMALATQQNPNTIKDQEMQMAMQGKRQQMQDKIASSRDVLQQQAQQQQKNVQQVAKQGAARPQDVAAIGKGLGNLASQVRPEIARMAAGGIVAFKEGRGVTQAMIEEYRRKYPKAVQGMSDAQISQLIQKADAEGGDPMPGPKEGLSPKEGPSLIGPYEAEEGAYPFPSNQGVRIGAKDFDKDIIKGAKRAGDTLLNMLPDFSGGPAGFFRDKKEAQEEKQRISDISTQASPEATAMADAERKQMTGIAPQIQPPAEKAGIDALSKMTVRDMQGQQGLGGLAQQNGINPEIKAQQMGPVGTTSQDASRKILDDSGIGALAKRKEEDVVKAARESTDKYTGRAETADALNKRIKDLEDYYKSQKMEPKEQGWQDFLSKAGAAGAAAPGKMGLAVSQTGERLRNERYQRGAQELEKLYNLTKEARTEDRAYAQMGMTSGEKAADRLALQQKAVVDIMSAASRQDIEMANAQADRNQKALSDTQKNNIEMLKVQTEKALRSGTNATELLKIEAAVSKAAAELLDTDDMTLLALRKKAAAGDAEAQKQYDAYLKSKGLADAALLNKVGLYDLLEKIGEQLKAMGVEPASGLKSKEAIKQAGYQPTQSQESLVQKYAQ